MTKKPQIPNIDFKMCRRSGDTWRANTLDSTGIRLSLCGEGVYKLLEIPESVLVLTAEFSDRATKNSFRLTRGWRYGRPAVNIDGECVYLLKHTREGLFALIKRFDRKTVHVKFTYVS